MSVRIRSSIELAVAVVAAVGCVLSWLSARSTAPVPPVIAGEPATTQPVYSAPALTLALLLATIAGVLAVVAVARLRRS